VVAVDSEGQPAEVPFELVPATPDDARRCAGVAARRVPPLSPLRALHQP